MKRAVLILLIAAISLLAVMPAFAAGGTSKGGEVPVTPGIASPDEDGNAEVPVFSSFSGDDNTLSASGTSKGGDVPVVTG